MNILTVLELKGWLKSVIRLQISNNFNSDNDAIIYLNLHLPAFFQFFS